MKNKLYICLTMLLLSAPLAATFFVPTMETTENTTLAEWPDASWDWLSRAGTWFEQHFAFRQNTVDAYSRLSMLLFDESPVDNVIPGKDGWLFYRGTLADYQGTNALDEWEVDAAAHNLKLMQDFVESNGSSFVVMICPNKNTVYPEYMDDAYYDAGAGGLLSLQNALAESGVQVVDIVSVLTAQKEEGLYYERDSHWNNRGALYGYTALMNSLGLNPDVYDFSEAGSQWHTGDLDQMLYPLSYEPEEDVKWEFEESAVTPGQNMMDDWIETVNPDGTGSLLMYRDSFGSALIPYLAESFETAWFSRLLPYNLLQVMQYRPDVVIVERVQRRIDGFLDSVPVMIMPDVPEADGPLSEEADWTVTENGDLLLLQGRMPKKDGEFVLNVYDGDGNWIASHPVFLLSVQGETGFGLYLVKSDLPQDAVCSLSLRQGETVTVLHKESLRY